MSSWEKGYGDMEFALDFDTIRLLTHHARDRDDPVRPGVARPRAGRAVAAQHPQEAARQGGRRRVHRPGRHRAGVHRLRHDLRARLELRLPRDDAGEPVQHRLLDPRHEPGRAAAARHPQPHVRRRDAGREREGRVQLRPARDRLPLRRGADDRRQPQRLQDLRQGDRRPARQVDDVHVEVQRARGQLLPHPPVAARRRRRHRVLGREEGRPDARRTTSSSPACWRRCATSR